MPKHFDPNIREDWDDSSLAMCVPENFEVTIKYVGPALSTEAVQRLIPKLDISEEIAKKSAAGMLKGTLKYVKDSWTVAEWLAYLKDELADVPNYAYLLDAAMKREKKERGDNPGNSG